MRVLQGRRGRGLFIIILDEAVAARRGLSGRDVIHVVAERDEEVEEQLAAPVVHFQLHRAAALERAAGADDER